MQGVISGSLGSLGGLLEMMDRVLRRELERERCYDFTQLWIFITSQSLIIS